MTEQAFEQVPGASVMTQVVTAMSADGHCTVVRDGRTVRLVGGRALMDAAAVIAAVVVEQMVWLVTRDPAHHTLHRFDLTGTPAGPPTALGPLGDDVTIAVNRTGSRIALIEGDRAVLVRDREGELVVEPLGERQRDRRVLVGARGVAERRGSTIKLRSGALPALTVPDDLKSSVLGTAAVVLDGNTLLVELLRQDAATAIVYDLRRGEVRTRIRLGESRVLAIAERAGLVVLGRGAHVALLDLRAGRCVSERILAAPAIGCSIDAAGDRVVLVDAEGTITQVGRSMTDLDGAAPMVAVVATPEDPEPTESTEPTEPGAPDASDAVAVADAGGTFSIPERASAEVDSVPLVAATATTAMPDAPVLADALTVAAALTLHGLGVAPASRLSRDALAAYLGDTRRWIDGLCATTIALARGDETLIIAARERERAASEAFAVWSRRGAPHVEIARELGLSPMAMTLLVLIAAPQIWGELARTYGACTVDPERPLVDELLVAHLLEATIPMRSAIGSELDADGALVRSGAVMIAAGLRPYAALTVHPAIARRLAGGIDEADGTLSISLGDLIGPREAIAALASALVEPRDEPARVVIRGRRGAGRRTLATVLAMQAGRTLELVDVREVATVCQRLRDVAMRGHLPCVDLDDLGEDLADRATLRAVIDAHAGAVFARAAREGDVPLAPGFDAVDLPPLSETERRDAWHARLCANELDPIAAAGLAERFAIGPGAIARACAAAVARRREGTDVDALVVSTIRHHRSARIATLADRVERLASWDELVVPADIDEALHELVARVRHRRTVLETWGMERVGATARGVTALFQGGPGTGKTMAAGVVARALGYELWRVDLSKIVSKWIGETEKNLAAVFDAAEEGEIVILFDEADSLFTRRTDVKSSNDKHANVATNYLLQRLDSFTGVAILTTNFGTSIDPAFRRRLAVQVEFPFPDDDDRERLWRAHLPPSLPTQGELGLDALARQYQMSGGYIRNAVLRAAYLAADRGGAITAEHLRRAVTLEKDRAGKLGDGRID